MGEQLFEGKVLHSETKPRGCGGLITLLLLSNSINGGNPVKFSLPGRHRIDCGELLRIRYEQFSQVNWISSYDILKKGKVVYSDMAAD